MGRKILALDVGGTAIKSGILQGGQILSQSECASNAGQGAGALVETMLSVAGSYGEFARIGVSLTGWVDAGGTVVHAGNSIPGFIGTPVGSILEERFHVPVAVENDVNCAALGELHFGAARDLRDFLCLTYGTGIGGSIVLGGRVYHGATGSAGAFGHFVTHAGGGRACSCGLSGCYEAHASTRALVRTVEGELGGTWNGRTIFERFYAGDASMERLVNGWLNEVSLGLINLIHCFNPSCILLGGGIMNEAFVVQEVSRRVRARIMPHFKKVTLLHAALGNRAGMLGAYYIAEYGQG